jgi:hypothetical protein
VAATLPADVYLVVVRCNFDDIPAFLTPDWARAEQVARQIVEARQPPDWLEFDWPGKSEFSHVVVVTFHNGWPVRTDSMGPSLYESFGGGD